MAFPLRARKLRRGWIVRVEWPGRVVEGEVVQVLDDEFWVLQPRDDQSVTIRHDELNSASSMIVLDDSQGIEPEVIEGPHGGLSVQEKMGNVFTELGPDDPAKSGPINTTVVDPPGGYDEPDVEANV